MRDTGAHHRSEDVGQDDLDLLFLASHEDDDSSAHDSLPRRKRSGTLCLALILVVVLTLVLATCTALLMAL